MIRSVAVLGGGVSGLSAARSLKAKGIPSVIIYEQGSQLGGVWANHYKSAALQVVQELYEFPDFPMSDQSKKSSYPNKNELQAYSQAFADHYKLETRLNTKVKRAKKNGTKGWLLELENGEVQQVDALVVANGMYSEPCIPECPGAAESNSMHSSKFKESQQVQGKNVVVLGSGKSAFDVLLEAKKSGAKSATLLYRNAHWGTPRKLAGLIPFQYVFLSRFGQMLVSLGAGVWPTNKSKLLKSSHNVLQPVVAPVFKIVEALFAAQLGQNGEFRPKDSVLKDFYGYAHVMGTDFISSLNAKEVRRVRGEIQAIESGKITLKPGSAVSELPCDMVICATGFKKSYDFFEQDVKRKLDVQEDGLYLYRQMVSPEFNNLAFCGSELAAISNIATYAIQAEWISRLFSGQMNVPDETTMRAEIAEMKTWKRSWMSNTHQRASLALLHQIHYNDSLLEDMGINRKRKSNPFTECFAPYFPRDYAGIVAEVKC